jgi:hypothetical protein
VTRAKSEEASKPLVKDVPFRLLAEIETSNGWCYSCNHSFSICFLCFTSVTKRQPIVVATDPAITEELRQAELHYQRAIQALSEVSQRKIDAMDPAMAQILNDNLATDGLLRKGMSGCC